MTKRWHHRTRRVLLKVLKYSILIVGALAAFLPFYWTFLSSVSSWSGPIEIRTGPIPWLVLNPRLKNFVEAWKYMNSIRFMEGLLNRAFLNSVIVTVSRTLFLLFASSMTAYALAIYKFRGRDAIFKIIVSMMFIPSFITLIPSLMIMRSLGWLDTYWALIIPGFVSAYSVFFLRQYMITIPEELIEAARIYGCSEFGIFWRIILPLSKPALATVGVLNAFWTWNDYLWPLVVITDKNLYTIQLALAGLQGGGPGPSTLGPQSAALLTIVMLPMIILAVITQKYFVKGLAGLGYTTR